MQPEIYYHIHNHANGSENLFREEENYRYFLQQWAKYIEPVAGTCCYCLMPNHIYFLIKTETLKVFENLQGLKTKTAEKTIIQAFSNLFNSYTKAFNKMHSRRGSLFVPNFKRKEITTDDYLAKIIHYIHHNPIHHRFCQHYEGWPHSSYPALTNNRPTRLRRKEVPGWFGGVQAFDAFHQEWIEYPEEIMLENKPPGFIKPWRFKTTTS